MKTQNRFKDEIIEDTKKKVREILWSYVMAGITLAIMLIVCDAIKP